MPTLPLALKLKRRRHRTVAAAQDLMVMEVYDNFPGAVIHGGTAIWRCYGGNRFSEDVDLYLPTIGDERLENFVRDLQIRGLVKEKLKRTENAIFVRFSYSGAIVSCEALLERVKDYVVKPFEMVDGAYIMVKTLRPEQIIQEKISAYRARRKVRDLYDIFFLLQHAENRKKVESGLIEFVRDFRSPEDERGLAALIISGSVPTVKNMLEAIESWAK